jgi:3-deoxy-manno-octulosonate cytidylyltransferase (CMP-KDO synthetase)
LKTLGIIPARYASTRFPGKPLVDIKGKTMIQRVYEQAKKAKNLSQVIVATDDDRIFEHVKSFGGEVMMTAAEHQSGTDRCAEVAAMLNLEGVMKPYQRIKSFAFDIPRDLPFDAVVNIQGDEPFIDPSQIDKVIDVLSWSYFQITTLAKAIDNQEDINNPNVVKALFAPDGRAIYFSRSPIPHLRNTPPSDWAKTGKIFKHIGLYAFRTSVLLEIARISQSPFEQLESLEQLRWLENGYTIGVIKTDLETFGIDSPDDLEKINVGLEHG